MEEVIECVEWRVGDNTGYAGNGTTCLGMSIATCTTSANYC
jgi:hypothetical protein